MASGIIPSGVDLTPDLADRLLQGARTGLFKDTVAIGCGIDPARLDEWIQMGLSPEAIEPYRTFARFYVAAEQGGQMPHVAAWQQAAATDWQAARAFLAARYPDQWGPKAARTRQAADLQPSAADAAAEEQMVRALLKQRPPVLMRILAEEGFTPAEETAPPPPPKRG